MLKQQLVLAIESRAADADDQSETAGAKAEPESTRFDRDLAPSPSPSLSAIEAQLPPAPPQPVGETRVVFLPRDPQWAYVYWEIRAVDRAAAVTAGGQQLALRLADVTGCSGGEAHPHALQEVVVDAGAHEWYLPVPLSDRDYRVELGFRRSGGGWISLAVSAVARMPASGPVETTADRFVPFSLDSVGTTATAPVAVAALGLHERLYQQASGARRRLGQGSEAFQEQGEHGDWGAAGQRSGVGLWASGRNDSGAGLPARQRSFWLVADAELIVYGATDSAATLRIGDEVVPLSADGTFRVQVPFRDGEQLYPISAVAADGVQKRSISLAFQRTTPEANVNSRDDSVAEWF
jgi:hypothetical protein